MEEHRPAACGRQSSPSWLLLILACAVAQLLVFAVLDARPPNDHDPTFADGVTERVALYRSGSPVAAVSGQLRDGSKGWYPQVGAAWMVAWLGATDLSRPMFRLAALPFLILLILGTYLASRELSGPRLALLSAWVVATSPLLLCFGRKWVGHYHAAALTPLGLWLGLRLLRSGCGAQLSAWFGFGLWQGLRLWAHPVVLADALLLLLFFPLAWWYGRSLSGHTRGAGLLSRLAASFAGAALATLPLTAPLPGPLNMSFSLPTYIGRRLDLVVGDPSPGGLGRSIDALASTFLADGIGWAFLGLLILPLALAVGRRRASEVPSTLTGLPSILAAGLLATVLIQLPIAARAISNEGYGQDWQFLLPRGCILLVWLIGYFAPAAGLHRRFRSAWIGALVLIGLTHSFGPMLASARGPDPVAEPGAWDSSFWAPWHHSAAGTTQDPYNSHLMVSRRAHGGEVAAKAITAGGHESLDIIDLTWHIGAPPDWDCAPPPTDSEQWQLGYPVAEGRGNFALWPFELNGISRISSADATQISTLFVVRIGPTWTGEEGPPETLCWGMSWTNDNPTWARSAVERQFRGVERFEELWNPNGTVFGLGPQTRCWKRDCPPLRVFLVERPRANSGG